MRRMRTMLRQWPACSSWTTNEFAGYAGCYFEDRTASAGATYQYRITDAGNSDKELALTQPFTVKQDYLPAVSGTTGKQREQHVLLNWEKNKTLYAYIVYRKDKPDGSPVRITPEPLMLAGVKGARTASEVKFVDSSVTPGTKFYEVRGLDVLGNISPSGLSVELVVKDMTPPDAATDLKGKRNKRTVTLSWKAPAGKAAKGLDVYRSSTKDTAFRKLTVQQLPASAHSFEDESLPEGDVYEYLIQSVDEAGNIANSRTTKVFVPDQSAPEKPTGLKAKSQPGRVLLSWNKIGEADVLGYYIYRSPSRNRQYFTMLLKEPVKENSFTDTLPGTAKTEFIYYVQAVDNSYNYGMPSDTVSITLPDTAAPIAPAIRDIRFEKGAIVLDAELRTEDAMAFEVFHSSDLDSNAGYEKLTATPVTEKTFRHEAPEKGKSHRYYIVSLDRTGNRSAPSAKRGLLVDEDTISMAAAGGLKLQFNSRDTAVSLSWKEPPANAIGYIVYRKEKDEDRYASVSDFITGTGFEDKQVAAGTTYQYKLRSFFKDSDRYLDSPVASVDTR